MCRFSVSAVATANARVSVSASVHLRPPWVATVSLSFVGSVLVYCSDYCFFCHVRATVGFILEIMNMLMPLTPMW